MERGLSRKHIIEGKILATVLHLLLNLSFAQLFKSVYVTLATQKQHACMILQ